MQLIHISESDCRGYYRGHQHPIHCHSLHHRPLHRYPHCPLLHLVGLCHRWELGGKKKPETKWNYLKLIVRGRGGSPPIGRGAHGQIR